MPETFRNYEEALLNPLDVKVLIFSFDKNNQMPDERIKTLINLEELSIEGYEEKQLSLPDEISQLKNLKELCIFAKNLTEIPKSIWQIKSLEYLFLEISLIGNGNFELSKLEYLQSLGLKVHNAEILTEDVFDNGNLKRFSLQSDDLKEIPNKFDRLINLNSLTLHCRNLENFPTTISNLPALKRIDVYNKRIKAIDVDFGLLENLEEFRWGQMSFFPTGLTEAKKLKTLSFDVSYFETIEANELIFQNLEKLELSFSKLKEMPKCFETLESIKTLDLGYNNFTDLEFDFQNLKNLSFLCLKRCENFENIDINKFLRSLNTLKNLKYLETPTLSAQQKKEKKKFSFSFEWIED